MGFFSRKKDKIYSLGEAMKLLQTSKYENYTTIPEEGGFRLIPMEQPIVCQEENSFTKTKRKNFLDSLDQRNNQNETDDIPRYNNYQSAKKYNSSQGISR